MSDLPAFVVSFPRDDLPYLAAAAQVDRKGIAWFDLDTSGVRLSVIGEQLGLVRPLSATLSIPAGDLPVTGFGVATAHLPSVIRKAAKETWRTLALEITPNHDTGTVVQDRTSLTGGIPLEASLFAGLLEEDANDLDRSDVNLSWDRPLVLDRLGLPTDAINFHLATMRECLTTATKLMPGNAENPQLAGQERRDRLLVGGVEPSLWTGSPTPLR